MGCHVPRIAKMGNAYKIVAGKPKGRDLGLHDSVLLNGFLKV
jgi:hypothetical protein